MKELLTGVLTVGILFTGGIVGQAEEIKTDNGNHYAYGHETAYGQLKKIETLDMKVREFVNNTLSSGLVDVVYQETFTHMIVYLKFDATVTSLANLQVYYTPENIKAFETVTGLTFDKMGIGESGAGWNGVSRIHQVTFIMKKDIVDETLTPEGNLSLITQKYLGMNVVKAEIDEYGRIVLTTDAPYDYTTFATSVGRYELQQLANELFGKDTHLFGSYDSNIMVMD